MSITPVPISIRFVLAPMAARSGNGEESWLAKWCTRKYAPSAPSSSAATARSIDCSSASEAERVCEPAEGVQWPNDKNPMRFIVVRTSCGPRFFLAPPRQEPLGVNEFVGGDGGAGAPGG